MNWLLLRGLARDKRHWEDFGVVFERRVPEATVHMLDLPGTGTEAARNSPNRMEAITEDLRDRWVALKQSHPGPWSMMAISMGGMTAMDWCSRFPHDFESLVLINSSGGGTLSPPYHRVRPKVLKKFLQIAGSTSPAEREAHVLSFNCNLAPARDPNLHARWTKFSESVPMSLGNMIRQLIAASRFQAPREVGPRTLVATSMQDRLTHPSCSWKLARRLNAALVSHATAGHDLPLDAPEWLCDQVSHWLSEPSSHIK